MGVSRCISPSAYDLLRNNDYLPFSLVDEKQDIKINVGWTKATPKEIIITRSNAQSESTCLGLEEAVGFIRNISEDVFNFAWENVSASRADGEIVHMYLFPNISTLDVDYLPCKDVKKRFIRKFPYYIYGYDIASDGIWPDRTEVFKDKNIILTYYSHLHMDSDKKRLIVIAEGATCTEKRYEAYGFTDNHSFIKQLEFSDGKAPNSSYGYLKGESKNPSKIKVYRNLKNDKKEWFYLSPSRIPGEVTLEPIKEPSENKIPETH